jgi:N utilization substance protein A
MAKSEFYAAVDMIASQRGISRDIVISQVEEALLKAYRRLFDKTSTDPDVTIRLDPKTGHAVVSASKMVVEDVLDPTHEIDIAEVRKVKPDIIAGQTFLVEITPKDFGRIAAQTMRQVLLQGLHHAERDYIYNEFIDREGQLVTAVVRRYDRGNSIIVEIDRGKSSNLDARHAEAWLSSKDQSPVDRYTAGTRMKFVITRVERTERDVRIAVSRSSPDLVRRLLEVEVPEVQSGLVEIRAIAREAGVRTKVAVSAQQEGLDPIGACVGIRGTRIQHIVSELGSEKIDVVPWSPDPARFIANALSPARVSAVSLNESDRTARVLVAEEQASLAIGKEGQNVRLAVRLTSWRIDIVKGNAGDTALLDATSGEANPLREARERAEAAELEWQRAVREERKVKPNRTVDYDSQSYGPLDNVVPGSTVIIRATSRALRIFRDNPEQLIGEYLRTGASE